jgi:hypothetical protein
MATENDAKLALDTFSEELAKLPHVRGLGIAAAPEAGCAALVVYFGSEKLAKDMSARAAIPNSVEITRPDGCKMTVPVQVIEQDELKFE